jgi:hypothetical protein
MHLIDGIFVLASELILATSFFFLGKVVGYGEGERHAKGSEDAIRADERSRSRSGLSYHPTDSAPSFPIDPALRKRIGICAVHGRESCPICGKAALS